MQNDRENITVAVIGCGAWGVAFGRAIATPACEVVFCGRDPAAVAAAAAAPDCRAAASFDEALAGAALVIVAVSSVAFTDTMAKLATTRAPVFWLTKGFAAGNDDNNAGEPLYRVAQQHLPAGGCHGAISGPSFASEVARGLPTALALAANCRERGARARELLHRPLMRLYCEDDLIGVCMGGALKNVVAIAAGVSDGLGMGENARAALLTRGLSEMAALTAAMGGARETLMGLAGAGDLMLTGASDLSRNRRLGVALATGAPAARETCEGRNAASAALTHARRLGVEAPIMSAVGGVLAGDTSPQDAVKQLLARPPAA